MRFGSRITRIIIAVIMVFTLIPANAVSVFASEYGVINVAGFKSGALKAAIVKEANGQNINLNEITELTISGGELSTLDCRFVNDYLVHLRKLDLLNASFLNNATPYNAFTNLSEFAALEEVVLPANLVSLGSGAFMGQKNLKTVVLPETLKNINLSAFQACTRLQIDRLPVSVEFIGERSFADCHSLRLETLHEGIKSIGKNAFFGCRELEFTELPSTLVTLGESAFSNCYGVNFTELPPTVKELQRYAFENCYSMENFKVSSKVTVSAQGAFMNAIMDSVLYDFDGTNTKRLSIVAMTLSSPADTIADPYLLYPSVWGAAYTLINHASYPPIVQLAYTYPVDTTVVSGETAQFTFSLVEKSVPYAGRDPLSNISLQWCKDGVELPNETGYTLDIENVSENDIGSYTVDIYVKGYKYSSMAAKLTVDGTAPTALAVEETEIETADYIETENYEYSEYDEYSEYSEYDEVSAFSFVAQNLEPETGFYAWEPDTSVVVPNAAHSVVTVNNFTTGDFASALSATLRAMKISYLDVAELTISGNALNPGDMYEIRDMLPGLKSLDLSGASFTDNTVPRYALTKSNVKYPLEDISLPESVTSIGDYAFAGLSSLRNMNLPDGITDIGRYAFYHCEMFDIETLPPLLTRIEEHAFSNCYELKLSGLLPEGITEIGVSGFEFCDALVLNSLPETLTTIEAGAFLYCYNLKMPRLPENLRFIGRQAFYMTNSLNSVVIPEAVEKIRSFAFLNSGIVYLFEGETAPVTAPYSLAPSEGVAKFTATVIYPDSWETIKFISPTDMVVRYNMSQDTNVDEGQSFELSFNVDREIFDSVQWYKNGTAIEGAVNYTLEVESADASDIGGYSLEIYTQGESIMTSPIQVSVNLDTVPLTVSVAPKTVVENKAFIANVSVSEDTSAYDLTAYVLVNSEKKFASQVIDGRADMQIAALPAGTYEIVVQDSQNRAAGSTQLTVRSFIHVTGVSISGPSKINLAMKKSLQLTALIAPVDADNTQLVWSSTNTKVLTVDQKGLVTAKTKGTAEVIVKTIDGNYSASVSITVNNK